MPTYDYHCQACDHRFEKLQSIKAEHDTICPACDKPELVRLIGAGGGILFKGPGFYVNDYPNSKG